VFYRSAVAQAQNEGADRGPSLGLTRVEVKPNLYMVVGSGANSVVAVTDAGAVVVGAKESERAGHELLEVAAGLTNQPVRFLIHPNHQTRYTHGSTAFPRTVQIVAHERARRRMLETPEVDYWAGPAAASLPDLTLTDRLTLYEGHSQIEVVHLGRGHTDGDLVVLFPDQHAAHTGDLFWNRRLPFIDRTHGGSALGLLHSLQAMLSLAGVETFIPGYGDVGTRADVLAQATLLRNVEAQVRQAIAKGRTRTQAVETIPIPTYARSDPAERFKALVEAFYDELRPTKRK
jgi:glyoxylase-like metal-dependent hydrolase (beta-lactamase superfamily II)